jgi:hypothetical protein
MDMTILLILGIILFTFAAIAAGYKLAMIRWQPKEAIDVVKQQQTMISELKTGLIKVNDILMPIAWTKSYQIPDGKKGKTFTTTIGAASDMLNENVRRLLVNGVFWTMDLPVPQKANVKLIGTYKPSAFGFNTDEYWLNKNLEIVSFQLK